jgi:6-phosphogluconolactonase
MDAAPLVVTYPDAALLAAATAARLLTSLLDAQATRGTASLVLTGGGIGTATLRAVRDSPLVTTVDWAQVDVWWGDERFVPRDSPERNDGQARAALLDAVPCDPARIFAMGDPDSAPDADTAAATYARLLAGHAPAAAPAPPFDVLLLSTGPDGHVASIFPGAATVHAQASATAVQDSPKPPPVRITLTFPAIRAAREVWILASGAAKADAVARALTGACPTRIPAAGARGSDRTVWLLDRAAAAGLPAAGIPAAHRQLADR